jgi:hypothetical protein
MPNNSVRDGAYRLVARIPVIDDWRRVLRRAWSVRLIVLAAALSGLEAAIGVVSALSIPPPIPPGVFASLAGLVSAAALVARFIAQKKDTEP